MDSTVPKQRVGFMNICTQLTYPISIYFVYSQPENSPLITFGPTLGRDELERKIQKNLSFLFDTRKLLFTSSVLLQLLVASVRHSGAYRDQWNGINGHRPSTAQKLPPELLPERSSDRALSIEH